MYTVTREDLPLARAYRWEKETPQRIFLTQPYRGRVYDWTWSRAVREIRCMAAYLRAQGWEPGSRVGILSKNCAWWIMADFAGWMAGYVTVPIFPSLRGETVRQILEHSDAKACFIGETDAKETAREGVPPGVHTITLPTAHSGADEQWEELVRAHAPLEESPTREPGDVATIIYTSGTTGKPKGAIHTFAALAHDARCLAAVLNMTSEERALSYLPLAHIIERAGLEGTAVRMGYRIYFTEGLETFMTDMHRARPTIFLSVPRLLVKFQQGVLAKTPKEKLDKLLRLAIVRQYVKKLILKRLGLSCVRFAASGGAPLNPDLLLWYRKLGLDLAEGYGMTEILITHLGRPGQVRPGFVGSPLEGVEAKTDEKGELLIRSPMNMLGYHKDPESTREAFTADGFFRTGDMVSIEPDGQLKIVGRVKEQFKTSKGKYVVPAPIESKLMTHPDVEACCLMGAGQPSPFAVVLLSPEARKRCTDPVAAKLLEQSLREKMDGTNAQLDAHERVAFIVVASEPWSVDNGLITPTLKVRRSALEARYEHMIEEWKREACPVIWETVPAGCAVRASGTHEGA